MRLGLGDDLDAGRARVAVVCGPIETAGMLVPERAEGSRRRARREHGEIALRRRLRPQLARAVERDDVGAELVGEQRPRAFGAREEHAARRARELGEQAFLRGDARHEAGSAPRCERLGGGRADRRHAAARAARPPQRARAAPFGLVTTTQS